MSAKWWTKTWNPQGGCSKCGPGCKNCYAEKFAWRHKHNPKQDPGWAGVTKDREWTGEIALFHKRLHIPAHWAKPQRIFMGSMTDLFHENAKLVQTGFLLALASQSPRHTFLVVTKRLGNLSHVVGKVRTDRNLGEAIKRAGILFPWDPALPNVHIGLSLSTRDEFVTLGPPPRGFHPGEACKRTTLEHFRAVPAACRFLSLEPCLESLAIPLGGFLAQHRGQHGLGGIILGRETGPKARRFEEDWARKVRDLCAEWKIPFFYKAGLLDGRRHEELPATCL